MADSVSKEQRSWNMSRIRGTDTSIEVSVRKYLFSNGFRYRKNVAALPGKPDIVLPKYKTVVFVHGCFWHKHSCSKFVWPSSNQDYWIPKITANVERDKRHYAQLENDGWNVIVVWECQLKKAEFESTMKSLITKIKNGATVAGTE